MNEEIFGDEKVQWRTPNGYVATEHYLWAPNGDAVVEIIDGKLEMHPDLQDALASLAPPRPARSMSHAEALQALRDGAVHGNWDHLNDD